MSLQPRDQGLPETTRSWKRQGRMLSESLQRQHGLGDSFISDFKSPDCERINFCCLKLPPKRKSKSALRPSLSSPPTPQPPAALQVPLLEVMASFWPTMPIVGIPHHFVSGHMSLHRDCAPRTCLPCFFNSKSLDYQVKYNPVQRKDQENCLTMSLFLSHEKRREWVRVLLYVSPCILALQKLLASLWQINWLHLPLSWHLAPMSTLCVLSVSSLEIIT